MLRSIQEGNSVLTYAAILGYGALAAQVAKMPGAVRRANIPCHEDDEDEVSDSTLIKLDSANGGGGDNCRRQARTRYPVVRRPSRVVTGSLISVLSHRFLRF